MGHEHTNGCRCQGEITRRRFLGAIGALGTLAASGCTTTSASRVSQIIDVHHHVSPPEWVAALKKYKIDAPPINNWTLQQSLDDMEKGGIATSMISATAPSASFLPPAEAAAVSRASNEYMRQLADTHPGRFGVFAMLPLPYVDDALKEMAYAFDVLKVDGIALLTSYNGKYLGDATLAPIMDELNRRKAVAYTHPLEPSCCKNMETGVPPVIIEFGTDTTRTIASLIFSGTSIRCRDIDFIFSHAGGTLTALSERFVTVVPSYPAYKSRGYTGDSILKELRSFHYDTAQAANPITMASLSKLVPTSQILFGSDFPYRTVQEQTKELKTIFSASDLAMIERGNALRLLPRQRA
jgi:predicted TIM-barrel fold metal-dependent hydrolase